MKILEFSYFLGGIITAKIPAKWQIGRGRHGARIKRLSRSVPDLSCIPKNTPPQVTWARYLIVWCWQRKLYNLYNFPQIHEISVASPLKIWLYETNGSKQYHPIYLGATWGYMSKYRYGDMWNINIVSHNLPSRNIVSHILTSLLDSLQPNAPIGATWEYFSMSHHRIAWSSNLPILLATKLPHRLGKLPSFFKGDDRWTFLSWCSRLVEMSLEGYIR